MKRDGRFAGAAAALLLAMAAQAAEPVGGPGMPAPATVPFFSNPATDPQGWSREQLQDLLVAAQHTAGSEGFEFRWVTYRSEQKARLASFSGLPRTAPARVAGNLVEAHPALRRTLAGMYQAGARSKPFAFTLSTGERVWAVVELVRRFPATVPLQPGAAFDAWAQRMVVSGTLPAPDRLAADPAERARRAFWLARTPAAIASLPSDLDPNVRFGDETTPLVRAILGGNQASARALLERGANPNRCTPLGCPLSVATAVGGAAIPAWFELLLARGAAVDGIDTTYAGADNTLLTQAILRKEDALTQKLLALRASVDGAPGVQLTPLQAAVLMARKDLAEEMLRRGARPLSFTDRAEAPPPVMRYNIYQAALESGDAQLVPWAESVSIAAARADRALDARVHLEQDGKVLRPGTDGAYALRAAPFRLVVHFGDAESGDVQLGASLSPAWMEEVRSGDRRNAMFHPFSSGAVPEPPDEDSYTLFVADACKPAVPADGLCNGSFMALQADQSQRVGFHEVRKDRQEWVREIRGIVDTSAPGPGPAVPLAQLKGRTLYLVASNTISLGTIDGLRLIAPQFLQLRLQ